MVYQDRLGTNEVLRKQREEEEGLRPHLLAVNILVDSDDLLRQNGLFSSFPYVCPEPVLVKR